MCSCLLFSSWKEEKPILIFYLHIAAASTTTHYYDCCCCAVSVADDNDENVLCSHFNRSYHPVNHKNKHCFLWLVSGLGLWFLNDCTLNQDPLTNKAVKYCITRGRGQRNEKSKAILLRKREQRNKK